MPCLASISFKRGDQKLRSPRRSSLMPSARSWAASSSEVLLRMSSIWQMTPGQQTRAWRRNP